MVLWPDCHYLLTGVDGRVFHFETDRYARTTRASAFLFKVAAKRRVRLERAQSALRGVRDIPDLTRPLRTLEDYDSHMARHGQPVQINPDDDAGHLIGAQWGGPVEKVNMISHES